MYLGILKKNSFLFLLVILFALFSGGCASSQKTFSDPNQAVDAFVTSLRNSDASQTRHILGLEGDEILMAGDPIEVKDSVKKFLNAYDVQHQLSTNDNGTVTLSVGNDNWPLPIPLAKDNKDKWYFDTDAGKDELINRRIGRNELDTIQTCLAIDDAQHEYAENDPDHDGIPAYAQKFISDPGRKNGLYWETPDGEPSSPLGPLVATAENEGYSALTSTSAGPQPYHGYFYRMLKAQGPAASGGARDYMVGNNMLGGFAVIAFPAAYGNSGVMTFIVNQDGIVYQRDLGSETAKLANEITTFNPDTQWARVEPKESAPPATQPAN
jgi:hypothetical protein